MNEVYFADGVSKIVNQKDIIKIEFYNVNSEDDVVQMSNIFQVAMTSGQFLRFKKTMDDMYEKMMSNQEKREKKQTKSKKKVK